MNKNVSNSLNNIILKSNVEVELGLLLTWYRHAQIPRRLLLSFGGPLCDFEENIKRKRNKEKNMFAYVSQVCQYCREDRK